ncbi:hypothetical protein U1Q18_029055 [Sarracenia purpurea var. burkii]
MAKRNLESGSDDIPTTSSHNTVFIDTTLGTHLAMIVSDTDTVSDLKKKIMSEHPRCFPSFGEIKVCSLKVKRKRYFYLLSDSMLVKSAYEGAKKSWFLSVDASSLQQCGDNQLSSNPDDSKQLALTCIRKTPSDDRKNHLPDSPLKRFSRLDASLLPQPGDIQYTNQNFLSTDRSGPGFSCKEVSKDLEMKVGHVDDFCKTADKTFETEKYDMLIEGNKISQTNIERRDGNSEAGLDYFHGQTSAVESLRMGPASETKYRSKKKSGDAVSNNIVEDNNDSIDASGMHTSHLEIVHPELSSGIPGKEVLNEMGMVYMDVGKEPCNTPDTNIRSDSGGIHGTHVECKKDKSLNTSGDAHQNDSLIEASKSRPAEKKKRKRESKGPRNPSEEHTTLLSNFSEETPKVNAKIPENSKENKLKPITATSDSSFIQPPEDVQLVGSSTIGKKKRKMKNKLARDQVLADEPSSLHDDREESSKENGELVAKDSDKAFVAAIVSEQNVQHATLMGTFEVSQKQKHPEPIQEVMERVKLPSSLPGKSIFCGPDTANEEVTSIAPEPGAGSGSKWRRKSKKHPSTNAKEFTLSALNELNNLKRDVTNSEHGNIVPDDQKAESSHPDKIAEQRELPQTHDYEAMSSNNCKHLIQGEADRHSKEAGVSANLLETNLVIESGKSAGRKRLKTRAKKSVATKPLMSSIEHADNSESGISSFVPHFNDHSSVVAKKEESIISQTKRTKISTPEAVDTTLNGANGETDAARTHESSHPDKIAEQRELPQTHDYEAMSFNNCKPLIQGEADRHSKEAGVSANLLETNLVIESGKSAGRKRLKTRAKKSVATKPLMSSIEHADNSESGISSFVPHFNDHSSVVAKKGESIISQSKRTKISTPEAVDTTLNGANGETDAARTHESSHPDKIAEQRELPQTHDYEAMSFNNCKPLIQGEADRHSKEAGVSANLLETNLVIESGKSAGRKRLKTRAKKSVATKPHMSSIEHADNSESGISSFVPHFNDHSSVVAKKEESIIPQTRRTKISTPEAVDTTLNGANGKTDEMSGNDAESLHFNQVNRTQEKAENIDGNLGKKEKKNGTFDAKNFASFLVKEQANDIESSQLNQINMTPKNTENMDQKSRKKTKKNQNSAAESLQPINELEVGGEEASSNDGLRHADKPSKTKMKTKLIETSSKNQLTGRHPRHALIVNSTEVPSSDTPEGDYIGGPLQCDVDGCNIIDANNQADVSKGDDDRVNFKDYFGTGEHKREVAPIELVVDKVGEAKRSDRDAKSKKNAKKLVVPSSSPDLQNPLRSYVNQASERKSHGVKAADSQDAEQIQTIPQESKHTDVVNSSKAVHAYPKENGESLGPTNPGSESRDKNHQTKKETKLQSNLGPHHVTVSKVSNKKIGEVVNSSRQHEKSLLATPGAIFRDDSTESSEDESGDVNSDSSTKAPSDNSSSSGYAEVESKSSLELPSNGIYGAKEKDGEENIIKSRSSGPKNITMDMILRGSSRFKKAKLTATQSQLEDTESQSVDFVPDSQANL